MEWHQMKYFKVVAKMENFTRAAEILSISQPSLSRSISKLEDELGMQLFERNGRHIILNKYGKMFLYRIERSINEIEIGTQEIRDIIHPEHGTISLAFLHSLGNSFIPGILSSFLSEFPNVKFNLSEAGSNQLYEQLLSGEADIALISHSQNYNEFIRKPLWEEELYLIVSAHHSLAQYDEVDLNDVQNESFITFKNGYGLRTITDNLCKKAGFPPKIMFEGEELETIAGLVEAKLGVSVIPNSKVLDKFNIKLIHIKKPICKRQICMTWKKEKYLSPVTKKFIEYVKNLSHVQDI